MLTIILLQGADLVRILSFPGLFRTQNERVAQNLVNIFVTNITFMGIFAPQSADRMDGVSQGVLQKSMDELS